MCADAGIELLLGATQAHARLDDRAGEEAARIRQRLLTGTRAHEPGTVSARIDELLEPYDGDD